MTKKRWNPYVLLHNDKVSDLWRTQFSSTNKKALYILGQGFDVRMNIGVANLIENCPTINADFWIINYDEGKDSSSHAYQDLIDENVAELNALLKDRNVVQKSIKLWASNGRKKRRIGDREASDLISDFSVISQYTDIIVDISAIPRGVYFSLIGKLLALIDKHSNGLINLFVCVAEQAEIDKKTQENATDEDIHYLHGFGGEIELAGELEKPLIWFPILGENKIPHVNKAYEKITEAKSRIYEICPTIPFPSKNPRRSDEILIEFHELLFDILVIEPQNIMYVSEQNPFEAYIQLSDAVNNYKDSLKVLSGCKAALSTFSSKLLSIGTLLTAYEDIDNIGILNVDSQGYVINDKNEVRKLKSESELFVTWLTGEPYNE